MKFKGIIFDLDGTLVNSLEDIADSMNNVLTEYNFPTHDLHAYKYFIGNGIKNLVKQTLPEEKRDDEFIEKCYKAMTEIYSYNYLDKTKPYDGIDELLTELSELNLKLGILSNKADKFTKEIAKQFFNHIDFIAVKGLIDENHRKPDPGGAIEISTLFNIPSNEIIYVGDTSVDMQTAKNAGMYPVGVTWGFREEEELLSSGAKFILHQPMDLLKLL